jgi:hypothetical protein
MSGKVRLANKVIPSHLHIKVQISLDEVFPEKIVISLRVVVIHVKGQVVPLHTVKAYRRSTGITPLIRNLGTRLG